MPRVAKVKQNDYNDVQIFGFTKICQKASLTAFSDTVETFTMDG